MFKKKVSIEEEHFNLRVKLLSEVIAHPKTCACCSTVETIHNIMFMYNGEWLCEPCAEKKYKVVDGKLILIDDVDSSDNTDLS